jgi:peptide-methionine (R)-S-oxide reductase
MTQTRHPSRRAVLIGSAALLAAGGGAAWFATAGPEAPEGAFPVSLTPEEWRERLTPDEYAVLREEATEPPFSSPLDKLWEAGTYACA